MSDTRKKTAPAANIILNGDGAAITLAMATQFKSMMAPMYTTPNILNAGFAVTRLKIQIIRSVVSTMPIMMHVSLLLQSGSTAARYMMCPVRKTSMPIRKIVWPFSLTTILRLRRMSAIKPIMSPMTIRLETWLPGLQSCPIETKQRDARPFSITAGTYCFSASFSRNTYTSTAQNAGSMYIMRVLLSGPVIIFDLMICQMRGSVNCYPFHVKSVSNM